jgi:hypothetical protein
MGRRSIRRQLQGWGILFGVLLALALVGLVVQLVQAIWPMLVLAGLALAALWVWRRSGASRPAMPTAPLRAAVARAPTTSRTWEDGRTIPTLRGDLVRSRAEARIADFLHRNGYRYDYEPTICGFRPDFFLPDYNLIVEFWGRDDEAYNARRRTKIAAYLASSYRVISLDATDWPVLEEELKRKLYRFDRGVYRRAASA